MDISDCVLGVLCCLMVYGVGCWISGNQANVYLKMFKLNIKEQGKRGIFARIFMITAISLSWLAAIVLFAGIILLETSLFIIYIPNLFRGIWSWIVTGDFYDFCKDKTEK